MVEPNTKYAIYKVMGGVPQVGSSVDITEQEKDEFLSSLRAKRRYKLTTMITLSLRRVGGLYAGRNLSGDPDPIAWVLNSAPVPYLERLLEAINKTE